MNKEKISYYIDEAARQFEDEVGADVIRIYYDRAMEIFAELIIKECATICETTCIPIEISSWKDMTKKEISAYTALALAKEIRKEFGVKEYE